jgi:hypothetical protein
MQKTMPYKINICMRISALSAGLLLLVSPAFGWGDYTHMAIGKAAGISTEYTIVGPDIIKLKFKNEGKNHFYDAERDKPITRQDVVRQTYQYDKGTASRGCLLGAIVESYRAYRKAIEQNSRITHYFQGIMAHYIGDLSMPLHLMEYDDFNKEHHYSNDELIENEVMANMKKLASGMKNMTIKDEDGLINEIIRLAEESKKLGYRLKDENRDMTREEAYRQAAMSASLIKAITGGGGK